MAILAAKIFCQYELVSPGTLGRSQIETLYMQILAKYKHSYIRHQNIDIAYEDPYTYRPNRLESLRLYHTEEVSFVIPRVLCRMVKLDKSIKHLEIDGSVACTDILRLIRYIPSLESLYIDNFPSLSREETNHFVKSVLASKTSLKTITLLGIISICPSKLFQMFKELEKLKIVNLDGKFESKNFDVSKIPYKMFKERGIRFNIRLPHTKLELKIETKNKSGLVPVDFLGINYKYTWTHQELVWNSYHEDHIKFQEKAKRALFVDLSLRSLIKEKTRLSKLFRHCKNVEMLDICLVRRSYKWDKKDFEGLKYFENLKHIFIELDNTGSHWRDKDTKPKCYDGFFKELTLCATTLRSLHLNLYGEANLKGELINFFKACADSLTHITLKFSYHYYSKASNMNGIYSCLNELKQLESLKVVYINFSRSRFGYHTDKAIFVSPTLKEISMSAEYISIQNLNLDFKSLTNLEKMQLCIVSLDDNSKFFPKKFIIPNSLRHIELNLSNASQKIWHTLLVKFDRLPILEILMLRIEFLYDKNGTEINTGIVLNDIKLFFKRHRSLKFMTYSGDILDDVHVFVEDLHCCREDDIGHFYGKKSQGILRRRIQKIYKIQKEIKEQIAVADDSPGPGGLKKFFLDLFSKVTSHYDVTNG